MIPLGYPRIPRTRLISSPACLSRSPLEVALFVGAMDGTFIGALEVVVSPGKDSGALSVWTGVSFLLDTGRPALRTARADLSTTSNTMEYKDCLPSCFRDSRRISPAVSNRSVDAKKLDRLTPATEARVLDDAQHPDPARSVNYPIAASTLISEPDNVRSSRARAGKMQRLGMG